MSNETSYQKELREQKEGEKQEKDLKTTDPKSSVAMIKVRALRSGIYKGRVYEPGTVFYVEESLFSDDSKPLEDSGLDLSLRRTTEDDVKVIGNQQHPGNPDTNQKNKALGNFGWMERVDKDSKVPVPENETPAQKKARELAFVRANETAEEKVRRETKEQEDRENKV